MDAYLTVISSHCPYRYPVFMSSGSWHEEACNFTYHCTHRPSRHSLRLGSMALLLLDSVQLSLSCVLFPVSIGPETRPRTFPHQSSSSARFFALKRRTMLSAASRWNCFISRLFSCQTSPMAAPAAAAANALCTVSLTILPEWFLFILKSQSISDSNTGKHTDRCNPKGTHAECTARIANSNSF